jgi:fatty-acyl-CoA synthase
MNIGQWPGWWTRHEPQHVCIIYEDISLTWKEFNRRINQLARAMQNKGVKKGDHVATLMANSNVFLEALFALAKLGAVMTPLNFRLSVNELTFLVNDSMPSMMIYSPEFAELVKGLRAGNPLVVRDYICENAGGLDGDEEYESWISGQDEGEPVPDSEVNEDDPVVIMYTSGTTGRPKGALLSHKNILWNAINNQQAIGFQKGITSLCSAPLFHIGAMNASAIPSVYVGGCLIIHRFFDSAKAIRSIEQYKVSYMFGVPVMFQLMNAAAEWAAADFSSINFFVTGGSPCPKDLIEAYLSKGAHFLQAYGMTESAGGLTLLPPDHALTKLGSSGRPLFHLHLKIIGNDGSELGPGEIGEIIVKGPSVTKGYWNMPQETAKSIKDGWLHTGDMGFLDKDGFIFITDRKKDMYISGGENVYPAEVESIIMQFHKVKEAAAIGIPDKKWGETGMAIIVPQDGSDLTEGEVLAYCRKNMAGYKRPQKIVFSEIPLPRTTTGKLMKKDLRRIYNPDSNEKTAEDEGSRAENQTINRPGIS